LLLGVGGETGPIIEVAKPGVLPNIAPITLRNDVSTSLGMTMDAASERLLST
jgi:hypothetical protein